MSEFVGNEEETRVIGPETNGAGTAPTFEPSLVDLLKQDAEEISRHKEVFLPVPGYTGSGLQIKYQLPLEGGKFLDTIARKVSREFKDEYSRNLYTAIDTMIELCQGLYVQPVGRDYPEPVPFDPDGFGMPLAFDARLSEAMGWTNVDSARRCVIMLFGGNDIAVLGHVNQLSRWMQNTNADLTSEFWQGG